MNELALFAGAGGGLLASQWLLGWKTICYVEIEPYADADLVARIKDGLLNDAPIWDDARTFDGTRWCGVVDIVTAGFPCQPFSVAGKRKGAKDKRNLWPDTIRIIREVRPRYILLENVSGLLADQYVRRIFGDLAESGYDCRWRCLSAAEVGANHRRNRLWILAYANQIGSYNPILQNINKNSSKKSAKQEKMGESKQASHVAYPIKGKVRNGGIAGGIGNEGWTTTQAGGETLCSGEKTPFPGDIGQGGQDVAHTQSKRKMCGDKPENGQGIRVDESGEDVANTTNRSTQSGCPQCNVGGFQDTLLRKGGNTNNWATEPRLGRVADELADRLDESKTDEEGEL